MKNEGGQKDGYCSKMVLTVAINVCLLFNVLMLSSSFLKRISVSLCKAELIGNWHKNRQHKIILLIMHNINGAPMHPAPMVVADRT
jgi:hypothetical protein